VRKINGLNGIRFVELWKREGWNNKLKDFLFSSLRKMGMENQKGK